MTAAKLRAFFFENAGLTQAIFKNTFWLGFGQLVSRLIRAVLIIYAARILGAAGYGAFSYALSLAGFFTIFSDIGLTPLLTRESAKDPDEERRRRYVATAFAIKLALIAVCTAIILVTLPLASRVPEAVALFPILVVLFAFDTIRDFTFAITRSFQRMEVEAGINITTNLAILVLGMGVLLAAPSAYALMAAYTLGTGIGMVLALWKLRAYFYRFWTRVDRTLMRPIVLEAWPFGVAGLLSTVMLNTDAIMIGWLRTTEEVGFYAVAQRILLLLYLLPGFLAVSSFPAMARFAVENRERFRMLLEKALHAVYLLAFPLTVGGILTATPLITFLFGEEYAPAGAAFQILLGTLILVFPGNIVNNAVFALDGQRYLFYAFALGSVGNIAANYFLIPLFGIVGSAWATIGTQLVSNFAGFLILARFMPYRLFVGMPKPFLAAVAMGAALLALPATLHVLLTITVGGLVYGVVLLLLKDSLVRDLTRRLVSHFGSAQSGSDSPGQ